MPDTTLRHGGQGVFRVLLVRSTGSLSIAVCGPRVALLPLAASDLSSVMRVEAIRPFPEELISGERDLHGGMKALQRPGPLKE
jgi:hypothetical protein